MPCNILELHYVFERSLHLFDQKYSNIVKYYYNLKSIIFILLYIKMSLIPVMAQVNFPYYYSVT